MVLYLVALATFSMAAIAPNASDASARVTNVDPDPVSQTLTTKPPKQRPEQLPTEAFANIPFVEHAELSPDGSMIAGLFGVNGEQRIVILSLGQDKTGVISVPVPDGTEPGLIRWVGNDNIIIKLTGLLPVETDRWYVSRLIAINRVTQKVTKLLWELGGQNTADVLWTPPDNSTEILVAAQGSIYTNDETFWPCVYRVNITNGRKKCEVAGRVNFLEWGADYTGKVRLGIGYDDNSQTSRLIYRSEGAGGFKQIDSAKHKKDERLNVPFLFLPGGDHALLIRDDEAGNSGIAEIDLMTQKEVKTILQPAKGEVQSAIVSYDGSTLLGATTTDADNPIVWIDPKLAELQANFKKSVPNSTVYIESFSRDQSKMLVRINAPNNPGMLYYFDYEDGTLRKVAAVNDKIGNKRLAPVKAIQYKARDGLEIEGILTLPVDRDAKNLPFIIMPHGGPWAQDNLQYDYWVQFLASRGYAVLQPNFRGSTGYGTPFMKKGEGQLGFAMQDDVTDGVFWAVKEGIADPKRVCILGASYGGYAAMWGVVKDPDIYRCAISIAGVSSLRREVNDFGNSLRKNLYQDQWQAMTPDFAAVSPINAIAKIKTPMLLIHGKKDVTVDHSQSVKMNAAMIKAGKTVEFVSIPLADHYFTRQDDRITLLTSIERFLKKYNPAD
jgi:dipeptidyl aminopeptidase/acylaminoacyl peptidase